MLPAPDALPPLRAELRVREAFAGAATSVWAWHIESGLLSDLDEGTTMPGYAPGEVAPTQDAWTALIHPDDRNANDATYDRHVGGENFEHSCSGGDAEGIFWGRQSVSLPT